MNRKILSLARIKVNRTSVSKAPKIPGVYIFWKDGKTPNYIGKAINLKNRLTSYFNIGLEPKTFNMVNSSVAISYIKVENELEALLLEAYLIRKHQPKYNIQAKDDKHPLYITITHEAYPRVITARKRDENINPKDIFFGPFPSSKNVYTVLKMLRRVFPYSDHKLGSKACFYSHIGLCNPCPSLIEKETNISKKKELKGRYLKNIKMIKEILSGNSNKVLMLLNKEMNTASKNQDFERALSLRQQIERLEYITQPIVSPKFFSDNPNLLEDIRQKELRKLGHILSAYFKIKSLNRIECFDVSHLSGKNPSASMVTFIEGEPDKNLYRRFRIRQPKSNDDISSMKEVARRRMKNIDSWGRPDLIIVDGGKAQSRVFKEEFAKLNIPVVGLEKRYETLVIPLVKDGKFYFEKERLEKGAAKNLMQRVRDEAHRFAVKYHHKLFENNLLAK
jgi:excinuclease ABC subunit C